MNAIVLQVFVSLMLVTGAIVLWLVTWRGRDLDHSDRLSLLPLEEEHAVSPLAKAKSTHAIKEQVDASQ